MFMVGQNIMCCFANMSLILFLFALFSLFLNLF